MLDENNDLDENAVTLSFQHDNSSLIYYKDPDQEDCLCIPGNPDLISNIFQLVHDELGYQGYWYCHKCLMDSIHIWIIAHNLYAYLQYCSEYQFYIIPCHKPYRNLQLIKTPGKPFYIIRINFILVLLKSTSLDKYDIVLFIINKFSKYVIFISGYTTSSAKD